VLEANLTTLVAPVDSIDYDHLEEIMKIACGIGLGVIIVLGLLFFMGSDFFHIDRCLDAGGRWDETTKNCDPKD